VFGFAVRTMSEVVAANLFERSLEETTRLDSTIKLRGGFLFGIPLWNVVDLLNRFIDGLGRQSIEVVSHDAFLPVIAACARSTHSFERHDLRAAAMRLILS